MRFEMTFPLICIFSAVALTNVSAAEPSKPIGDCSREYADRKQSLEAARVSASDFFHQCWWHTRPGKLTSVAIASPAQTATATISPASAQHHARPMLLRVGTSTSLSHHHSRTARLELRRTKGTRHPAFYNFALRARNERRVAERHFRPAGAEASRIALRSKRLLLVMTASPHRRLASLGNRVAIQRKPDVGGPITTPASRTVSLPPDTREGRQAWIGAMTASGPRKAPAVIIGSLTYTAVKGSSLHCWDQDVLFTKSGARSALVCDGKTELGAQKTWFESYK